MIWGLSHTYIISYRNVIIIIPVHVKQNYITPGGHIFLYISMFPVEIHIQCVLILVAAMGSSEDSQKYVYFVLNM